MKQNLAIIVMLFLSISLFGQGYLHIGGNKITLDNGTISKEINFLNDSVYSTKLYLNQDRKNFIRKSKEFSFTLNELTFNGYSGWEVLRKEPVNDGSGGIGIKVVMRGNVEDISAEVELYYILFPGLPIIRKWIKITNRSEKDVKLENLNIADLHTRLSFVSSVVYHNYGRMKHLGRFIGNWNDPVCVVHDITGRRGLALGNETAGVLKRTTYHTEENNIEIGLTHTNQDFAFRKWLKTGESWISPRIFVCPYTDRDNGFEVIDNEVNRFMVKYMKPMIVKQEEKPTFVYNTWYPFRTFINDSLVREVAKAASACGVQEFILDDGWQVNYHGKTSEESWGNNYGDWKVDTNKFPGGLKPTFDYIRSLGMKPGLWISIGAATKDAKVFKEHPEWFVKNKEGELSDLHISHEQSDFFTSCYGTEWKSYIKNVILRLVHEHGLAYAKLDFAVVTSAYVNDGHRSGCYASDHPYHRDRQESHWVIYNRLLQLFDELQHEAPELFIDCTFETAGKLQLMDYAIAQHAEGNWLSNFEEPSPLGPLRVRQMAWWRSPALPASSLVIGNQSFDDPGFELSLKSLIGSLPIVLGDPRELSENRKAMIRKWSDWMQEMQERYDYMSYRRDLPGFGEPREGAWDGWQRINFQSGKGGIFGVFRQGAAEKTRTVVLNDLMPNKEYIIRSAPDGKALIRKTGTFFMNEGFKVHIKKEYDGKIFEVGSHP